ncbi:hypothetical protein D3C72_894940 [compost metagenome]
MVVRRAAVAVYAAVHLETVGVIAHARHGAQPGQPLHRVFAVEADAAFAHPVFAHRALPHALHRVVQTHGRQPVIARLHAQLVAQGKTEQLHGPAFAGVHAGHRAPLALLELVALFRIGKEIREVAVEFQLRADQVGVELEQPVVRALAHRVRQAVARGVAAIAGREAAETADLARFHGAQRHLVGGVPAVFIGHARHAEAVVRRALAVAQDAAIFTHVLRHVPGTVVAVHFQADQQGAWPGRQRIGDDAAHITVLADGDAGLALRQFVGQADAGGACRGEIAFAGEIRSLLVIDTLHQLGNEEIEVGIALPVRMRAHIDGHAIDIGGEIRAMVEVKAAQEILVGLAVAAVLGDDQPGHEFQQFARAQGGPVDNQLSSDDALAGRIRRADGVVVVASHAHGACFIGNWSRLGLGLGRRLAPQAQQCQRTSCYQFAFSQSHRVSSFYDVSMGPGLGLAYRIYTRPAACLDSAFFKERPWN